jgi:hypothetical protein
MIFYLPHIMRRIGHLIAASGGFRRFWPSRQAFADGPPNLPSFAHPSSLIMPTLRRGAPASRASPRLSGKPGRFAGGEIPQAARSPSPSLRHRDRQSGRLAKAKETICPGKITLPPNGKTFTLKSPRS